jgi:[acyl-carrier-protein] S-malonyltransferase
MSTAWIFAGHGSQYVGMGRPILHASGPGRDWLAAAEQISGRRLGALAMNGPLRDLADPCVLEPLLTAVSGAYADLLAAEEGAPDCVAGYSAGHVTALYAAGVIDQTTSLRIACVRGQHLKHAAALFDGGMVAVHGLPEDDLARLAEDDALHPASIAARNGPSHMVYSGTAMALARAAARASAAGAITGPLDVAGPWHSPWLEGARAAIATGIAGMEFRAPCRPVWSSLTGLATHDPDQLRMAVSASVACTVEWHATVIGMLDAGVRNFVEVSPGRTLWGLLSQVGGQDFQRRYVESPRGRAIRPRPPAAPIGHPSFEQEST